MPGGSSKHLLYSPEGRQSEQISIPKISTADSPDWPSEMLRNGHKPVLELRYPESTPLLELAAEVWDGMSRGVDRGLVCQFLTAWAIKEFNSLFSARDPWVSFGIQIAVPGANVNISHILNIRYGNNVYQSRTQATPDEARKAAYMCLVFFRLIPHTGKSKETYFQTLCERMLNHLGFDGTEVSAISAAAMVWVNLLKTGEYSKIVGALDMLTRRQGLGVHDAIKICTMVAHHKDCAGLNLIAYFANQVGMEPELAPLLIFVPVAAEEFKNMLREGQEIDQDYSYVHWASSLGISRVSPWSVSRCKNFALYACTVGAMAANQRGQNAYAHQEVSSAQVLGPAIKLGFLVSQGDDVRRTFFEDSEDREAYQGVGQEGGSENEALALAVENDVTTRSLSYADAMFIKVMNLDLNSLNMTLRRGRPQTVQNMITEFMLTKANVRVVEEST